MQLYNCVVRLSGQMTNEVSKTDVTAAEIKVLKALHTVPTAGVESVHQIIATRSVNRSDEEERARLQHIYGRGLANSEAKSLNNIIGFEGNPLPKTVPGVDSLPAPKTGRRATKADIEVPAEQPEQPETIDEAEFS